ncbi:hypothetical protein TNCV_289661 [Trichonephila clavipes]|nr:hypothetical protein TNCV_289661 [Trichonephila clavipes]
MRAYCAISVHVSLDPEVHEQMFRAGGQSDAKPPVLSSQAILLKNDEIVNVIQVVDLAKHLNLEVNSDDVQELLNSHNQALAIDELIEMYEQEQDIEEREPESLEPVQSQKIE